MAEKFDDYFYGLTLEFESLKTRAEKDAFYSRHREKAKKVMQTNGVMDFGFRRVLYGGGDVRWQSWAVPSSGKLMLNGNTYSSKGLALMSVLYGVHTGKL